VCVVFVLCRRSPQSPSIFEPAGVKLSLQLTDPSGTNVDLPSYATTETFPLGDEGGGVPTTTFWFSSPVVGTWTLSGTTQATVASTDKVLVVVFNEAPVQYVVIGVPFFLFLPVADLLDSRVYSTLSTYETTLGAKVGLAARLFDEEKQSFANWRQSKTGPEALAGAVQYAEMTVATPTGQVVDYRMHDDGLHADGQVSVLKAGPLSPAC
jgi:hypothetical protein